MARIIYVEDDELMGEIVKEILTDAGHLVGVIGHGTLAFETVAFKRPELVILDSSLPGMGGVQIVKRMRQIPGVYLTPVLMLTARGNQEDIDAAMAAGADDYIIKPFDPANLVSRVNALLSKNDWRNASA